MTASLFNLGVRILCETVRALLYSIPIISSYTLVDDGSLAMMFMALCPPYIPLLEMLQPAPQMCSATFDSEASIFFDALSALVGKCMSEATVVLIQETLSLASLVSSAHRHPSFLVADLLVWLGQLSSHIQMNTSSTHRTYTLAVMNYVEPVGFPPLLSLDHEGELVKTSVPTSHISCAIMVRFAQPNNRFSQESSRSVDGNDFHLGKLQHWNAASSGSSGSNASDVKSFSRGSSIKGDICLVGNTFTIKEDICAEGVASHGVTYYSDDEEELPFEFQDDPSDVVQSAPCSPPLAYSTLPIATVQSCPAVIWFGNRTPEPAPWSLADEELLLPPPVVKQNQPNAHVACPPKSFFEPLHSNLEIESCMASVLSDNPGTTVYWVELHYTDRSVDQVAVKAMLFNEQNRVSIDNEIRAYHALESEQSDFLVHTIIEGSSREENAVYFAMEYFPANLVSQLVNYPPSPRQARVWAAEILLGVEDLHERNILHADLKPDNIFITYDGHACIGDYGLAVVAKPGREIRCQGYRGTQGYVAPETYRSDSRKCGQHFSKPADIWAFGCIIYDLLSPDAQLPYHVMGTVDHDGVRIRTLAYDIDEDEMEYLERLIDDPVAVDLLCELWQPQPEDRSSIEVIKQHPFFEEINWDLVRQRRFR